MSTNALGSGTKNVTVNLMNEVCEDLDRMVERCGCRRSTYLKALIIWAIEQEFSLEYRDHVPAYLESSPRDLHFLESVKHLSRNKARTFTYPDPTDIFWSRRKDSANGYKDGDGEAEQYDQFGR